MGIWIDSREARIVQVVEGKRISVSRMFSGLSTRERFAGETSRKVKRGFTGFDFERQHRNRLAQSLKQFCETVARVVGPGDHVYVLGPAQTRLILEKTLHESNSTARILGVEACDKLSDNQLMEKVRLFFDGYVRGAKPKKGKKSLASV